MDFISQDDTNGNNFAAAAGCSQEADEWVGEDPATTSPDPDMGGQQTVDLADSDRALIENGYEPVATIGKAPKNDEWQKRPNTIEAITADRAAMPTATNTGLRTGQFVGVDLDVAPAAEAPPGSDNPDHTTQVMALVQEVLGENRMVRVGAKGAMLAYRNAAPISKIKVIADHPVFEKPLVRWDNSCPGNMTRPRRPRPHQVAVEILGQGQQFVAYGLHPDTGRPYHWPNAHLGFEPLRMRFDELPEVTPEKLGELADRCKALFEQLGYVNVRVTSSGTYAGAREAKRREDRRPVPKDYLVEMLPYIPATNYDGDRDGWIGILAAIQATNLAGVDNTDDVLLDLCDAWSSNGASYEGRDDVEAAYYSLDPQKPGKRTTFGTLYHHAKQNGWDKPAPGYSLEEKYGDASRYAEYTGNPPPPGQDGPTQGTGEATQEEDTDPRDRFRGRPLSYWQRRPDPEFWDDEKTLPKADRGATGILYGDSGAHKTNVAITKILDAIQQRGARVLYAAGEGGNGVTKLRFPAHLRERGLSIAELDNKLRITDSVPLFASAQEVLWFIEANSDFNPDIVVLDTLATAIAGEDENGSLAAAFLTDNGPAGHIKRAFNATVILPAHSGKDPTKGIRGHSGLRGNVDFVLYQEAHDSGAIKQTVEKMRDGRDGFAVYFKTCPKGDRRVPVPVKINKTEYDALAASRKSDKPETPRQRTIRAILAEQGAYEFGAGLTELDLARALAGQKPNEQDVDRIAAWKTQVARERKTLQNAHGKAAWKDFCAQQVPPGGEAMQWRWFIVPEEAEVPHGEQPVGDEW